MKYNSESKTVDFNEWRWDKCYAPNCKLKSRKKNLHRWADSHITDALEEGSGLHAVVFYFCDDCFKKLHEGAWLFPFQIWQFHEWSDDWGLVAKFINSKRSIFHQIFVD